MKPQSIDRKYQSKFILVSKLAFESTKASGFELGTLTESCVIYGNKYNIKPKSLMPYVSYLKMFNKINSKSFRIRKWYIPIIEIINSFGKDDIIYLINVVENSEENFDLLNYLKNNYGMTPS